MCVVERQLVFYCAPLPNFTISDITLVEFALMGVLIPRKLTHTTNQGLPSLLLPKTANF